MTDAPELHDGEEAVAAEYALGLLSAPEMAEAERRIAADPAFRAAVAAWQERLAGFAEGLPAVAPPDRVKRALDARLFAPPRSEGSRIGQIIRFVFGSLAGAAVVALAVVLIAPLDTGPPLRAEMAAGDRSLVIEARLERGAVTLTRLEGGAPAGRVLELWLIGGDGVPVSLGVLPDAPETRLTLSAPVRLALAAGQTLAISEEPPGGSPTGQPTGAVLATGQITEA